MKKRKIVYEIPVREFVDVAVAGLITKGEIPEQYIKDKKKYDVKVGYDIVAITIYDE